jgi:site-specific recombinase XerD
LAQENVSLIIIKELMGHEDIKTTLIYAHLSQNNHYSALKTIDNNLSKK